MTHRYQPRERFLSAAGGMVQAMLTIRQRMTLDLAGQHYRHSAIRDEHALQLLDYTPARYAQVLDHLLDHPDAEREYPQLVHRLRRVRNARRTARSMRP